MGILAWRTEVGPAGTVMFALVNQRSCLFKRNINPQPWVSNNISWYCFILNSQKQNKGPALGCNFPSTFKEKEMSLHLFPNKRILLCYKEEFGTRHFILGPVNNHKTTLPIFQPPDISIYFQSLKEKMLLWHLKLTQPNSRDPSNASGKSHIKQNKSNKFWDSFFWIGQKECSWGQDM